LHTIANVFSSLWHAYLSTIAFKVLEQYGRLPGGVSTLKTMYVKTPRGAYIHQLTIGAFPCADCAANLMFFMKRLEGTWNLCELNSLCYYW
jgi:hypothetical protein